ncbi:hypothetical protein PIIN_10040 [Serendipita indica DSM 11827]|uniref:F-box domain-containing protein n=1 Tax=Serendipita indica (strain DSM 11827) TaxID=1109443 RepID=G4TXJ7_SERID|nr:hypothetical protein PIIN_10040 [Serendipita indica DSM 11827]
MNVPSPGGLHMASIYRLPTETMRSILLYSYKEHGLSRWNLACIDSRTRRIVVSTPLFWTSISVDYRDYKGQDFESLLELLRTQLRRCGPVVPLSVAWLTSTTERHMARLLQLFIDNNAPLNRWKRLIVKANGIFPTAMLNQERLGEFTRLERLVIAGSYPHFFFHHLEKTQNLENLKELTVHSELVPYDELSMALPRVMSAIKKLEIKTRSTFSLGIEPNIFALKCDKLEKHCRFPHLQELTVNTCSIQLKPASIPLVTHLDVRDERP